MNLFTVNHHISPSLTMIQQFPFDVIQMKGKESIDFLQRISSNDFTSFSDGKIQKTLFITDKGRIVDASWVIHRNDHLLLLVSNGLSEEIIPWLQKYIIMEDIELQNVSSQYEITLHFDRNNQYYHSEYFGIPVAFELHDHTGTRAYSLPHEFDAWRIENGIPIAKKELTQEFNPLELNLWDWISFTKGCYIGQEVIARLDTYQKIQRRLCKISSATILHEQELLLDELNNEIGKLTSVLQQEGMWIGLAVVRSKHAVEGVQMKTNHSHSLVNIDKVFHKEQYGRN